MIINGREIAESVYAHLPRTALKLGIIIGEASPVIDSFVKIKQRAAERLGVELVREELPEGAATADAVAAVLSLAARTDGIIVQLPLPQHINVGEVLAAIPPEKDVDGISPAVSEGERLVRAPVARAVQAILEHEHVETAGKNAVVVGSGRLVGKPCASLLTELGASVRVLTHGDSMDALKDADIIVLGAGETGLVRPEHLKKGVVLIDAGTSDSPAGEGGSAGRRIAGDADPTCAEKASVFTPVPGGVGPVAVAMIFKNLFALAK